MFNGYLHFYCCELAMQILWLFFYSGVCFNTMVYNHEECYYGKTVNTVRHVYYLLFYAEREILCQKYAFKFTKI